VLHAGGIDASPVSFTAVKRTFSIPSSARDLRTMTSNSRPEALLLRGKARNSMTGDEVLDSGPGSLHVISSAEGVDHDLLNKRPFSFTDADGIPRPSRNSIP